MMMMMMVRVVVIRAFVCNRMDISHHAPPPPLSLSRCPYCVILSLQL